MSGKTIAAGKGRVLNHSGGSELFRRVWTALRSHSEASESKEKDKEGKHPPKLSKTLLAPLKCVFRYSDGSEKVRCNDFHGAVFQV